MGARLAKLLAMRGHEVRALHRKPDQAATLRVDGAIPVAGDLTVLDVTGLASLIGDADTLVFSAGADAPPDHYRTHRWR